MVFVLSFLLVFGLLAMLGLLAKKTRSAAATPYQEISLQEPAGSSIEQILVQDNLVYISLANGGQSDRLVVFDTTSAQPLIKLKLN